MKSRLKFHLGQKIKRIRASKGITQEELSKKIGKTRALVSYYERTGEINKYTFKEICDALNVTEDFVEELEDNTTIKTPKINYAELLLKQLSDENRTLKDTIEQQWILIQKLSENISKKK